MFEWVISGEWYVVGEGTMRPEPRKRTWGGAWLALVVAMTGCGPAGDDPRGEAGAEPPASVERESPRSPGYPDQLPADRPAERRITVEIEGFEEELRFVLYRAPAGFPLPFSTYIPTDMVAEAVSGGEGATIRFIAAFGGQRNEGAAVRMMAHRAGATEAEAIELLRELAAGLGTELVEAPAEESFGWSVRDFRNVALPSRADAVEGTMAVGRRGDRYFSIAIHYPAEYGDGFGPRARQILLEWRWEGTGEALMGPEPGLNGQA
jgi:hypothetical protein